MSEVFIVNQTWSYLFAGMSRDESGDHSAFTRPGPALADLTHPRFKWIIEGDPAGPVRIRNAAFGYLFGSAIEKNGDWTAWCRERPSDADLASERFQWRIVRDGDATHLQNLKFNFLFAADRDLDEDDHFVELTRAAPKGGKFSWSLHAWGLEDWMGHVDGGRSLAALTIPGTHDSGANRTSDKGREWSDDVKTAIGEVKTGFGLADTLINAGGSAIRSIGAFGAELVGGTVDSVTAAASMCQVMPIAAQLRAGVRFLDIRVRNHGDSLLIFHGAVYQHQSLGDVLTACYDFLAQHPRECLLMSVKRDHDDASPSLPLGQRFDTYVDGAAGRWYTGGSIPRLDDVRGKIVFLRRFGDPGAHRGKAAHDGRANAVRTAGNEGAAAVEPSERQRACGRHASASREFRLAPLDHGCEPFARIGHPRQFRHRASFLREALLDAGAGAGPDQPLGRRQRLGRAGCKFLRNGQRCARQLGIGHDPGDNAHLQCFGRGDHGVGQQDRQDHDCDHWCDVYDADHRNNFPKRGQYWISDPIENLK